MRDLKTLTIFFRARDTLEGLIKSDIASYGLNITEFGTLDALYHKGPLTVNAILEKVLVANSSMSYVLESLRKKGLITKTKHPKDKRSYLITLTDKGKDTFECMYETHQKNMRAHLDVLDEKEEKELQRLLKKIGKHNEGEIHNE